MKLFFISSFIAICIACSNSDSASKGARVKSAKNLTQTETLDNSPDTLTIGAVGDIMFGTNFPDLKNMPPNQGKDLLQPFESFLKKPDIMFGNVEGVFLDKGGIPKGSGGQVYCFRQPFSMANYYVEFGFDLLSVANNHVADFGEPGLKGTDSILRKLNLAFAGSLKQPTTIIEVKGKKIGLAAFAPHKGSVDMNNIAGAVKIVTELKKKSNIVIVSFHGGAEGVTRQRVPKKKEIFYNQDRGDVHDFAHKMIDAGADVLIGHGPHVVRAMELYKNKIITYSLGNFCTYGKFSLGGASGNAPLLNVSVNEKGDFLFGDIVSGKQFGEGGPVLDEVNRNAFKTIAYLTQLDFPNTPLIFKEGKISKK